MNQDQDQDNDDEVPFQEEKKLTDWKNPPTIMQLKQDLQDGRNVHNGQEIRIREYLDDLNITGRAKPKVGKGKSQVQPKLIRKQAEWRYAALSEPYLSTDDVFKVDPVTWEDRKAAQQNQLVLNNQFNTKIHKVKFIDNLIRTLVDEGTAIVKVGWDFREEQYQETIPVVEFVLDPEFLPTIQYMQQLREESPSEFDTNVEDELKQALELSIQNGAPYRPNIIGQQEVTKTRTVMNCPTVDICHYSNVIIDPTCEGDVDKATFGILSFDSSLAELKKDGKYKNLDKINVTNNGPLSEPDHVSGDPMQSFQFGDTPRKKIVVYEYWGFWDINGDGLLKPIVASWVGDVLIRMQENPFPDKKLPFVVIQYLPIRRSVHGEPDGVLISDNQKIAGALSRGMIDIMAKSAAGQTGMRKDMLDTANKKRFEQGEDYEFNAGVNPREGVHTHTFNEIPASAQILLQQQNLEAESITGVKSFSQGMSGNSLGAVAAGVRGALDAASKRELGILRRISAGIVEIARKFVSMNAEWLEEEEVVRITNEKFVKVRRDDLQGSFDLKIDVSTAEEDEKKAQELAMMLQTMGPNLEPEMTKIILSDIARLRKMPELAKRIESYQPEPDPMAEKMQQLQMALLEAQIATEQAKAASFGGQAQLSVAKVSTEVAKAGNIQAVTDKTNLDYVEQESGVEQERNLQRQGAQAEAQMGLKAMDIYLQERKEKMKQSSSKK